MGVLRTILPMDSACLEWLDQEGVSHPPPAVARFPTPREITDTLSQLSGYAADISSNVATGEWLAHISSIEPSNPAWASLRVSHYRSDDEPHELYFPKGWSEVVFTIVERLSHHCGPLVVADDSGGLPVVVCPNDSIPDLISRENIA